MTTALTTKWLWITAAALLGALIALALVWQAGLITRDRYVAVYLQTGDIYFGKQVGFWGFALDNVWFFQHGQDGSLALVPLSSAAWHPSEPIYINRDQVVFWTSLDPDSSVARAIQTASLGGTAPVPAPPSITSQASPEPSSTSSPSGRSSP